MYNQKAMRAGSIAIVELNLASILYGSFNCHSPEGDELK